MGIDGNGGSEELAVPSCNLAMDFIVSINLRNDNLDHHFQMSDDEIIAVVQAHKEGKKIQACSKITFRGWYDVLDGGLNPDPIILWNFYSNDYRVAPEPREPREWDMWITDDGMLIPPNVIKRPIETIRVREVIEEDKKNTIQKMMEHATGFKND